MNADTRLAVHPEEDEAFLSSAKRSTIRFVLEGQVAAPIINAIDDLNDAIDTLRHIGALNAIPSCARRSTIGPVLEGHVTAGMLNALADLNSAVDTLLALGWKRAIYSAVDGTEALAIVRESPSLPIKATFCGDWDGSWFAELVDGEMTPIQPWLLLPLGRG